MDNRKKWIVEKIYLGWILVVVGLLLGAAGIILGRIFPASPYNFGILTGLGIFLAGIGVNNLLRYRAALKDEQVARHLTVDERDERTVFLRRRAGNRGFWVSMTMVYAGWMWQLFAGNGNLPLLSGEPLLFFLGSSVLIPFAVYAGSILIDQKKM